MMSPFDYYGGYSNPFATLSTASLICFIIALIGGIVLYFVFMSPKNEGRFTGFLGWLYQTLNFQKLMLEMLLKIIYVIVTGWLVLMSIVFLFTVNFLSFLMLFLIATVGTRIVFEFALLTILICRNVSDINRKMKSGNEIGQAAPAPEFQQAPVYNWSSSQSQPSKPTPPPPPPEPTCPGCGRKFGPDEAFCVNCGTKLK